MNVSRSTWLISLTLAIFVIVSGQVRAFDAWGLDAGQGDDGADCSVLDDDFVALPGTPALTFDYAPAGPPLLPCLPPLGRVVVPDLFRPPIRPLS